MISGIYRIRIRRSAYCTSQNGRSHENAQPSPQRKNTAAYGASLRGAETQGRNGGTRIHQKAMCWGHRSYGFIPFGSDTPQLASALGRIVNSYS